jgi:prepilin signal peptidase PulO-like enzyme (type II secretory pathway)
MAGQLLRIVGVIYKVGRGREGMGLGDSDLMMMVGCFLGWQAVLAAFVISLVPGLLFGFIQLFRHGDHPFPFGPSLALGTLTAWLSWSWIGPRVLPYCYNPTLMTMVAVAGPIFLFVACLMLRLSSRPEPVTPIAP